MKLENGVQPGNFSRVALFSLLNIIKLLIFHYGMGVETGYWRITMLNALTIMAIFTWINQGKEKRRGTFFLIVHGALAFLFLANSLYVSHFATVLPVHIFYQIRHLRGVSNSIGALFKLKHLVYLIDLPWLWWEGKRNWTAAALSSRQRWLSWVMIGVLLSGAWMGSTGFHRSSEGYYTPFNLGMLNYHVYDLLSLVSSAEAHPVEEAVMQEIFEEPLPEEEKKLRGIAAGKNVLFIQAESLQSFVIGKQVNGQWITPVLNSLLQDNSLYFSRYYEQVGWGNTSDAEFVSQTGLHAATKNYSYKEYEQVPVVSLPGLLKEAGYYTAAFHGNEESFWNRNVMYPNLGIGDYISKEDLAEEEVIGMGLSDRSLFSQAVARLKDFPKPFYSLLITLTSHYPYEMDESYQELELGPPYEGSLLGNYLQTVHYLDQAVGQLIEELKAAGLYEDTLIVLYGDHHGIKIQDEASTEQMEAFLGKPYSEDEMLRVPLLIHLPGSDLEAGEIERVGGQVDLFPTIANLLGLELSEYTMIGRDLLNTEDNFALTLTHTAKGSFIEGDTIFIMSKDGIFENSQAWDVKTGEPVDLEACRAGYERVMAEIQLSEELAEGYRESNDF